VNEGLGLQIDILGGDHVPEEITPYPDKLFYWIDPWRAVGDGAGTTARPGGDGDRRLSAGAHSPASSPAIR
jgi:hypothetical protein